MEIYVQSRGFAQDDDYRWLRITKEIQKRVEVLPLIFQEVTNLIDAHAFSVVIARTKDHKLLFLVTGIDSQERLDFRGRKIRNSVAWIGNKSLEPAFKKLAIQSLDTEEVDSFKEVINQAIKAGGEEGFKVEWQDMIDLAQPEQQQELLGKEPDTTLKL
ncbi:MAG: hypothetical protein F6K23_40355 [Okeania sp. SIO2C9]|uniref:hypothetical protein n=1 Tax=Okeania sp. SIO2C9 TaxID=2607791 RepID=UPI0013C29BD0|nr:hypothetical protein [Okeania sp. SIO2C9]NEQ78699.1 hypothetical protein [Okeania sp. SIO2C9]